MKYKIGFNAPKEQILDLNHNLNITIQILYNKNSEHGVWSYMYFSGYEYLQSGRARKTCITIQLCLSSPFEILVDIKLPEELIKKLNKKKSKRLPGLAHLCNKTILNKIHQKGCFI